MSGLRESVHSAELMSLTSFRPASEIRGSLSAEPTNTLATKPDLGAKQNGVCDETKTDRKPHKKAFQESICLS